MSEDYRIDSHKLMFHPKEVSRWQAGELIYPVYMEVSPSGACNHRCKFCALDYLGYEPRFINTNIFMERLTEFGGLGIKSIMYGGEGEPLLHKDIAAMINHTKKCGIDVALTTNGTLLSGDLIEHIADSVSWIKVSIDAGTPETYAAVHQTKSDDFSRVMENLSAVVDILRAKGSSCTVGAQMILLPENVNEIVILAERIRQIGLKYLVIKPYSQHLKSNTRIYENIDYKPYLDLVEDLKRFNDENFSVIVRANTMNKTLCQERGYDRCQTLPFWSYIDSAGNVWGCSTYLGDERFRYGNIYENTFKDIWTGELRRKSLEMVTKELNPSECRINCRMDEVNRFLWKISHRPPHVNFI